MAVRISTVATTGLAMTTPSVLVINTASKGNQVTPERRVKAKSHQVVEKHRINNVIIPITLHRMIAPLYQGCQYRRGISFSFCSI